MEKSKPKLLNIEKGFSLFEIVIALVILSVSLLVIYNLILSTSVSIYKLEDHYLAKEVANNRIALINTIEKPSKPINRNGMDPMGGKNWKWEESFYIGISDEFQIPVRYIGVGEGLEDLQVFNKYEFVDSFFK